MSGARVVVKNGETGQEFTATTSDNGTFNVPSLGTTAYTVTVTAQGFKQAVVQNIKVDVGKASSVNVALESAARRRRTWRLSPIYPPAETHSFH